MALKFVPPKEVGRYALFVDYGDGRGRFKSYNDLGHAKTAYHHNRDYRAKLLENVNGEWYTLYDVPANTLYKDLPWVKEVKNRSWYWKAEKYSRSMPMTRDEYAEWRIRVEYEKLGIN